MLLKLLTGMDQGRFCNSVISLTGRGVMAERIEAFGIPVFTCDMVPGHFSVAGFARLLRHLRAIQPDLVQTWLYHADLLGGVAARLLGIKPVLWNIRHSNLDWDKNKAHTLKVVRLNAKLSTRLPARIICNSANSAAIHQAAGFSRQRFVILPNGFDTDAFQPSATSRTAVRQELGIAADVPLIGLVARFDPQKNHQGFVHAASLLIAKRPDAHFLLAGGGVDPENAALAEWLSASPQLRGHVHLLGRRDDIPRLTATLDLAVCSSWGEGFSNAVGEAMCCEVPCVVTDVGDCADLVGDTGWVIKAGDMQAMSDKLHLALTLSATERQTLGQRARQRVIERYSLPAIVRRYESLYLETIIEGNR